MSDIYVPSSRGSGGGMTGFGDMLDERLLRERIIWLEGPVMDENSNRIAKQLQVLAAEDPERDISLYINSPGGSISAASAARRRTSRSRPSRCSSSRSAWPC